MKFSQLLPFVCLVLFYSSHCWGQEASTLNSSLMAMGWKASEINAANTAAHSPYLQPQEKEVILIINLVRLYPQHFLQRIVAPILEEDPSLRENSYFNSLFTDLQSQQSISALQPDETLSRLARDYAISSGKDGYFGHGNFSQRINELKCMGWQGENIHYGSNEPLDIVVDLLIDNNVPSLGHRKNLLSESYEFVGVGIASHSSEYKRVCVIDFSSCR
ncbi:MAG: CAP domain-containing protein [Bacteroidales bacterium]